MLTFDRLEELRDWRATIAASESLGFVPTMGALHEGHVALVRRARSENDRVAVSIFVNPVQFGPDEDFDQYPRRREEDQARLLDAGADCLWFGQASEMYPPGFATKISLPSLTRTLCGPQRPGHFEGVATVVLKLFNLFRPQRAYFGRKDFQQCVVIDRLVRDLDLALEVVACPTVRESSGLARSSRNLRLTPRGQEAASILYRSLRQAAVAFGTGKTEASTLVASAALAIAREPLVHLEYLELVDPVGLMAVERAADDSVLAVAAKVESVRLIDNITLGDEVHSLRQD